MNDKIEGKTLQGLIYPIKKIISEIVFKHGIKSNLTKMSGDESLEDDPGKMAALSSNMADEYRTSYRAAEDERKAFLVQQVSFVVFKIVLLFSNNFWLCLSILNARYLIISLNIYGNNWNLEIFIF